MLSSTQTSARPLPHLQGRLREHLAGQPGPSPCGADGSRSVREAYRVWHGASHLDDGRLAPVVGEQFDGWNQATATDGKYKGGDHIPGMNVGGWYDAGDFDL
jgi:hypothetical protein